VARVPKAREDGCTSGFGFFGGAELARNRQPRMAGSRMRAFEAGI
jgi:hypothetical protein